MKPESCSTCVGASWEGFMEEADGRGTNGVLLVGEALGEQEAREGRPFVGKAGLFLQQMLQRKNLKREDFLIDNVIRCRPPENKLRGEPYEAAAIDHCRPFLDGTIATRKPRAIVALGDIALQRLCDRSGILKSRGYPEWSLRAGCWIVPTYHPAYILRGNFKLQGVWLHDVERAVEIAARGFIPHRANYLLDPTPMEFEGWIARYRQWLLSRPGAPLSYDIETPYKQEVGDEDALDSEEDPTYTILRVGFAYKNGDAVSIPWRGEYIRLVQELFDLAPRAVVWNGSYDTPRLTHNGIVIRSQILDAMWAWHVVNSDLPKALEFVAPFFCPDQPRWKHLSKQQPALYNALDAEVELRCWEGIEEALRNHRLWEVFDRHIVQLDEILREMEGAGLLVDQEHRRGVAIKLAEELIAVRAQIEEVLPREAWQIDQIYKKPVSADEKAIGRWVTVGATQEVKVCGRCGKVGVTKGDHTGRKYLAERSACHAGGEGIADPHHAFNHEAALGGMLHGAVSGAGALEGSGSLGGTDCGGEGAGDPGKDRSASPRPRGAGKQRKADRIARIENPCHGAEIRKETRQCALDARIKPFSPSNKAMKAYAGVMKHKTVAIYDKKTKQRKITFNDQALDQLIIWYPGDPVYRGVKIYREVETLLTRYTGKAQEDGSFLGGVPIGPDGRAHTTFGHEPSTLRMSSNSPNMQNIPSRGDRAAGIKGMFIAGEGRRLLEVDYSAIEAVLVGHFANSPSYIRLAKLGVHDYLNSHILTQQRKITHAADLSWSDGDLKAFFVDLKGRFSDVREVAKRIVHSSNYAQTPRGAYRRNMESFESERQVKTLQDLYFEVCPDIRPWQRQTIATADRDGFLRNPFGYIHRFWRLFDYKRNPEGGWDKEWSDDARRALAFLPQSTAAAIIKEAILRLGASWVREFLRLQVHDSLVNEIPLGVFERAALRIIEEMVQPIPELGGLVINVEAKAGERWGALRPWTPERVAA